MGNVTNAVWIAQYFVVVVFIALMFHSRSQSFIDVAFSLSCATFCFHLSHSSTIVFLAEVHSMHEFYIPKFEQFAFNRDCEKQ